MTIGLRPATTTSGTACVLAVALAGAGFATAAHLRQSASIPMRDGAVLAADVYLPAATGIWPVVLIQTPYDKRRFVDTFTGAGADPFLNSPDYAFVVLDWRGFFASAGAAASGSDRGLDGYDAVEWTAAQPWCDSRVATWGASALGKVQFDTAATHPPHLAACVPVVAHMRDDYLLYYPGGIWARNKNAFVSLYFGGSALLRAHPLDDHVWAVAAAASPQPEAIDVPMLHVSGWYDHQTAISLRSFAEIRGRGGPRARAHQSVLVGPWTHGGIGEEQQGELAYPAAAGEASRTIKTFLDNEVRGIDNGWPERPAVRFFQINEDAWIGGDAWPPAGVAPVTRFLTAGGGLAETPPPPGAAPVRWISDPANPVPTVFGAILLGTGGAVQGPGDLHAVETREDVRTFTTPVLATPLRIQGQAVARLWVSATAVDVDLTVRLTEVLPDGHSVLIVDGARRASLRNGYTSRAWLSPGQPVAVAVELPPVAITVPAGHRLRALLAAANYDRYDRNMQDGSALSDDPGAAATPAEVTLLLEADHPSAIELPAAPAARPVRRRLAAAH